MCSQIRQWQGELDRLNDRESELYDALVEAGYDMPSFYKEHGHIDLTDDMPASERAKVDAILESVRPTKRKVGEVDGEPRLCAWDACAGVWPRLSACVIRCSTR